MTVTMAGFDFSRIGGRTRTIDGITWRSGRIGYGEWSATVRGVPCEISVAYHRGTRSGYSIRVGEVQSPNVQWGGERTIARASREAARLAAIVAAVPA